MEEIDAVVTRKGGATIDGVHYKRGAKLSLREGQLADLQRIGFADGAPAKQPRATKKPGGKRKGISPPAAPST